MANDLTGDFDVVTEFAIPAINRVLAVMHRSERFLHSIAIYVNDRRKPVPPPKGESFSIVGSVDRFGDPIVDHTEIGTPIPVSGQPAATDPTFRMLDPVVNPELVGATVGPIVPSNLKGWAQLQLSPPTIDVADASGSNVAVTMQVMARYLPDRNTPPLAEFVRGQLQLTAPVSQVASQAANVINVDLKVDNVGINFSPNGSSGPLSIEDLAAINLLIRNALKTSFLPSTNPLPPSIDYVRFKALVGNPNAIGLMLNMAYLNPETHMYDPPQEDPGDPGSMNTNFLGAGDDFAYAVGRNFILGKIQFKPIANRSVASYNLSFHLPTVKFQDPTNEFPAGSIVLTVKGLAARTRFSPTPSFDFTVTQTFTLKLVSTTGGPLNTAELKPEGDANVDVPWYVDAIQWLFAAITGVFQWVGVIGKEREENLREIQPQVRDAMDVNKNLGGFLNSLVGRVRVVEPIDEPIGFARARPLRLPQVQLAYTSVGISSSGIILHGSLVVLDWPPAHVEFEQISATTGTGPAHPVPQGPDYSALKTWIPGGEIHQYEWRYGSAPPFLIDPDKFVYRASQPGTVTTTAVRMASFVDATGTGGTTSKGFVSGYTPLCLTVRGTRLSASGPVLKEPVNASVCEYSSFPIVNGVTVALGRELPLVALTQPGSGGLVQVTGHASAQPDGAGKDTPNLIVHFANEQTAGHLDFLTQALSESRREDAPAAAILAVFPTNQLSKTRYSEGVIYAEEHGGVWERLFKVKIARQPLTLIVGPNGNTLWQQEGELDSGTLAAALHKVLVKTGPVRPRMLRLSLRIGQPAPNFVFEVAPGRQLTLRKLEDPAELVFWKSSLGPSIETVRDRQERARKAGAQGPVVLAINDGEAPELAKKFAAEHGLSATLVTDLERNISLAYGVNIWPTTVFMDPFGVVREIHYGRFAVEDGAYPSRAKSAAAR